MDNSTEKVVQHANMLMVKKLGIEMDYFTEKMVQQKNMLVVASAGI